MSISECHLIHKSTKKAHVQRRQIGFHQKTKKRMAFWGDWEWVQDLGHTWWRGGCIPYEITGMIFAIYEVSILTSVFSFHQDLLYEITFKTYYLCLLLPLLRQKLGSFYRFLPKRTGRIMEARKLLVQECGSQPLLMRQI